MFGSTQKCYMSVSLDYDPAADDEVVIMVPGTQLEITKAYVTTANAVAADATNYFSIALRNVGTAGTATTAIAAAVGGTAGWAAKTPVPFTISNGTVTPGQAIVAVYDENGTGTFGQMNITLEYVIGQA